jgi:hypothetical protein
MNFMVSQYYSHRICDHRIEKGPRSAGNRNPITPPTIAGRKSSAFAPELRRDLALPHGDAIDATPVEEADARSR